MRTGVHRRVLRGQAREPAVIALVTAGATFAAQIAMGASWRIGVEEPSGSRPSSERVEQPQLLGSSFRQRPARAFTK